MRRSTRSILLTVLSWLVVVSAGLSTAIPIRAQDRGEQLVERLRTRLRAAPGLKADFTQTFTSEFFEETESSSGSVILQGSKYRVETPSQVFVSNGVTTWIYDRSADQVLINDYVEDETTVSLNRFLLSGSEEYHATEMQEVQLSGVRHRAVRLVSADPAAFFPECTMFIRESDDEISRLEVVDLNGTTITFDLRNITLDPSITDRTFDFKPDPSSDVVDLRSS